jgi:hypothetical protein
MGKTFHAEAQRKTERPQRTIAVLCDLSVYPCGSA